MLEFYNFYLIAYKVNYHLKKMTLISEQKNFTKYMSHT